MSKMNVTSPFPSSPNFSMPDKLPLGEANDDTSTMKASQTYELADGPRLSPEGHFEPAAYKLPSGNIRQDN